MGDRTLEAIRTAQDLETQGEDAKAAQIYQAVLAEDPDNTEARRALTTIENRLNATTQQMSTLIGAGLYNEAVHCASAAISSNPQSPKLLSLLGTALMGLERFEEAREIFEVVYALEPTTSQTLTNLGACSIKLGDSGSAVRYFSHLILLNPADADSHYKLGLALETDNKAEAAVGSFGKAVECNPKHVGALTRMAYISQTIGFIDHAIEAQSRAVDAMPEAAELWLKLGEYYVVAEKHKEAVQVLAKTLELDDSLEQAKIALAFAYLGNEQSEKAFRTFRGMLDGDPDNPELVKGMAMASKKVGDQLTARKMFSHWMALKPDSIPARTSAAEFIYEDQNLEEARQLTEGTLARQPNCKPANMLMAMMAKSAGNFDEFAMRLRRVLELDPDHTAAMRFLVDYAEDDERDALAAKMESIAADKDEKLNNRTDCLYGLSQIARKQKDYAKVVSRLDEVSKLVKADHENTHLQRRKREIAAIKEVFSDPPKPLSIETPTRPIPIFILGMPRSGTTMTEQVVSNHSAVFGGGELPFARLAARRSNEDLSELDAGHLRAFRDIYLEQIAALDTNGSGFVTDKMPMNFTYLGLIALAIPEAKIVHLNRSPEAVCWSNFRSPFGAKGLEYSYHQEDTGKYYREYQDLMEFWRERFGNRIYDLKYEKVTENPDKEMRPVFDWLGLPWEEGVTEIYRNQRSIRTASYKQVRSGIYKGSSEEWRSYEPYIQPMLSALRGEDSA